VTALFFGDRVGRVRDPLGNIWWIQAHVEDVSPSELARRPQDPAAAEALRLVESSLGTAMGPEADPPGCGAPQDWEVRASDSSTGPARVW
jgi:hypothetical protein